MTNYSNDYLLDFETLPIEAIALEASQIEQAIEISNQILNGQKQWQTYLDALAFFCFQSWLNIRAPELTANVDQCSLRQPSYANFMNGVFHLQVKQFKLCLLARGTMDDGVVNISRAGVDLAEYAAHFYVLVNVNEEQEEAIVEALIDYQQLQQQISSSGLQPQQDWNYEIPDTCFNSQVEDLLLYLRCLDANAISLPEVTPKITNLDSIKRELEPLIPQLSNREIPLWQILSWEEAIPILTNQELLNWLYQLQTETDLASQPSTSVTEQLTKTGQKIAQQAIDVGLWLQNELDELAESLAWNLFPAPTFALSSLRSTPVIDKQSPVEELEAIIAQLRNSAIDIPIEARGAYQDFTFDTHPLRLFVVTWAIPESESEPEWTLLIILGTQPEHQLPEGLRLQLKEEDTLLDEKIVDQDSETHLYSRVIGNWDEQFTVAITLSNGETLIFPSFAFST